MTGLYGGVFIIDHITGEIAVNWDAVDNLGDVIFPNLDDGQGVFIIIIYKIDPGFTFNNDEIRVSVPFGFSVMDPILDPNGNTVIIIERDKFLLPDENP